MGVELWRQGATQKLVTSLNHLGICCSSGAARRHVDTICTGAEKDLEGWRRNVEVIEECAHARACVCVSRLIKHCVTKTRHGVNEALNHSLN